MNKCSLSKTPSASTPVAADVEGEPFDEKWEYASIIGMLLYIANNDRPVIAYSTHQCA
jgi:hypothetical protein